MPPESRRDPAAPLAERIRSVPALPYWVAVATVSAAAIGVFVLLAILVNPLTSVLAGVIVAALGITMSGATRGRRLPPELLFYAGLALVPLFIALALISLILAVT